MRISPVDRHIRAHSSSAVFGQRLDETVQGNGLGLAAAQDFLVAYRGKPCLGRSNDGGLEVAGTLPRAPTAAQPMKIPQPGPWDFRTWVAAATIAGCRAGR